MEKYQSKHILLSDQDSLNALLYTSYQQYEKNNNDENLHFYKSEFYMDMKVLFLQFSKKCHNHACTFPCLHHHPME